MAAPPSLKARGNELKIGCEIETIVSLLTQELASTGNLTKDIIRAAKVICTEYARVPTKEKKPAELHTHFIDEPWKGAIYSTWILTDDSTIKGGNTSKNLYPLELVSPIMTFKAGGEYRKQIREIFGGLQTVCSMQGTQSCGFHIHISPHGKKWELLELKGICKAIIHFERAMAVLLPSHRNGSWWAKTFRNNISDFKNKTVGDCIKVIEACETVDSLSYLMNDKGIRYYAWNFQNLDQQRGTGTIEWRQPAGMDSAEGCIAWIELAIAFVQAARRPDLDCRRYPGTVEGLRDFVWMGVITDASDARFMDTILNKTKTGAAALVAARHPTDAELEKKIKEDQMKNLMLRKLIERLNAEAKAARDAAAKKAAQDAAAGNGGRK